MKWQERKQERHDGHLAHLKRPEPKDEEVTTSKKRKKFFQFTDEDSAED